MKLPLSALVVLVAYVVAITAFGTWLGRRGKSVRDYFLAARSVPWWAIATCIVATETSTLTFIGAPGTAYRGDWTFLQLVLGYVVGRLIIAALFIPAYFRGEIYTSYELLQQRFGSAVRTVSAVIFLLYRTLGDGIRLHAAALVLSVAAGIPEWWCIVALGAAMILYTEEGGVIATIWTDCIQMFVYLAGAIVCLVVRDPARCPDGVAGAMAAAAAAGKLALFDFSLDPRVPFTFWAGLVGGAFLTLATHGTDHYLVQRLLVARSQKDAVGRPRPLRLPGDGAVRAVPVPRHAALGALRRPALRPRRRGAADLRLHASCPAAGRASSWPRWWRPRSRRPSTRWPRPRCATSTCPTSGRAPRRRSSSGWAARSRSSGASPRCWSRWRRRTWTPRCRAAWPR